MADTLLVFGVEKLWNLLARKSVLFKGVDELTELKSDLNILRSFLKDADAKKHTSEMVRKAVKEIKEIIYDAEDIIEITLLEEELGKTSGIRKSLRRFSCVTAERRGLAFDIEVISKRISKVIHDMQRLGVQQVIDNDGYIWSLPEIQRETRQYFARDYDNQLVGLEENVEKIVGYLLEEDKSQVVSITGMGGIGKTTLARQVFIHETVKSHFAGLAWVCVSQQFTREYVWGTILQKLSPECNVSEMTEDELQEKLFRLLGTQKTLIVFDDVWREEDWDIIKPMFPRGKGWKVLLTSRKEGVAAGADPTCFTFKTSFLTPEESWKLFQRIAFPRENTAECKIDEEMEDMGKQMIMHCEGLPLSIKALGRLLAVKYTSDEWKMIYDSINSQIIGGTSFIENNMMSSVYHVLCMSYEELPIYLKECFLYLAHLPELFSIDVEDLSYYWAAEDILRPKYYGGASIREVTNGYIKELAKRNMVICERDDKTSGYQRCRLHDMMREVCLHKAEEENFVQIVDARTSSSTENSQSHCKSHRVVIHYSDHPFQVEGYIQNPRLRSLLFIKHYWGTHWMASGLCFTRLQLMRVLDLSRAEFKGGKLPSSIGKLINLRYLSLCMANVSHLPSSMQNLKQLLYLNLCVGSISPIYMRNFLKEMRALIYLFLPDDVQDKVKLALGNLTNLETLENFSTKHSSVTDLQGMTRLRTLSIIFNGEGCTLETLSSTLGELSHLENLTIGNKRVVGVRTTEKRPPVNKVGLGEKSWRMVCSSGGFPKLKKLYLNGLAQWEEWIVEEGSMPVLQTLSISWCRELKELPVGLRFITSLEELTIITSEREFKEKLSERGDDYYKVQHIPHFTISEFDIYSSYEECHNKDFRVYDV